MERTSQHHLSAPEFDSVSLKLASPEKIRSWSRGEVVKPETINYRTQRSEKGGLFDEKIFGPERDYECYCGKYRGIRFKSITCEKCGVEVTRSIVRRERMGHIELASPVSHIWFLRGIPSRIAIFMGLSASEIEKVVYFAGYIITKVSEDQRVRLIKDFDSEYKAKVKELQSDAAKEELKERLLAGKDELEKIREGRVLEESECHRMSMKYGSLFEASIGAEAIHDIFKKTDLKKLVAKLEENLETAGAAESEKIGKRLQLVRSMIHAGLRPEWMFLSVIPVIPPALRPMVALDGGRHATSDVNDLYRRVINRNNRLKRLKEINAPDVILRNEKRILQEAVDSLIDNSIRHGTASAMSQVQRRPLKSLADNLKGKQGLLRGNLLGKRVDYSGRSVIVVGPDLKLDQCGLPKHMALELFRPFVIRKLLEKELAYNIRGAGRLIDDGIPEVWAILEDIIKDKYVLLNRAPTLHRLGIQAFRPILIEGNAIQVHPLVCAAFNADFDGDQMAVHVPLSDEAQLEAKEIMASNKNLLKPGNGEVITAPRQDIVLGCYWMTKIIDGAKGENKYFSSPNAAITVYDFGALSLRAKIKVLGTKSPKYAFFEGKVFETSVGRLLFNSILPKDYPYINKDVERKALSALIDDLINRYGFEPIPDILDKIKEFGCRYTTVSGTTFGLDDITVPKEKEGLVAGGRRQEAEIRGQYQEGLLTDDERRRAVIEVWHGVRTEVEKVMPGSLQKDGPVYDMIVSGARGSFSQLTNMAGMKGLIMAISGEPVEFPVTSSAKEGYSPLEYFISTHGSRSGLASTALSTSKAGYLTRRLFDVAQDAIITEENCGTSEGTLIPRDKSLGFEVAISKSVRGRYLLQNVVAPDGSVMFKKGHLLSKADAETIENSNVQSVSVRSPLGCKTLAGICQHCYGVDPSKGALVEIGEAVGTVAAQAIGEPGTQLTMNVKHAGGAASLGGDVTSGLPRVEELFEKRVPKAEAVMSKVDGTISEIREEGRERTIIVLPEVSHGKGKKTEMEYPVPTRRLITVSAGQNIKKGELMTDGSADIDDLFKYAGKERAERYIITEAIKIYELQGASISRKHLEVIVRQMFSRLKVRESGDTELSVGDIVDRPRLHAENTKVSAKGGKPAVAETMVMGIKETSLTRQSFLSSSSFEQTTKMLVNAALKGSIDRLVGLKENVIIGRLIPAGTGFKGSPKAEMMKQVVRRAPRQIRFSAPASMISKVVE